MKPNSTFADLVEMLADLLRCPIRKGVNREVVVCPGCRMWMGCRECFDRWLLIQQKDGSKPECIYCKCAWPTKVVADDQILEGCSEIYDHIKWMAEKVDINLEPCDHLLVRKEMTAWAELI